MDFSPLTIIIALIILVLLIVYVLRVKIIVVSATLLSFGLLASVVICMFSLFVTDFYKQVATSWIDSQPIGTQLVDIDKQLSQINDISNKINQGLGSIFGGQQTPTAANPSNLHGQVIDVVAGILRVSIIILSFTAICVIVYLRYSIDGVVHAAKLEKRVAELEKRLGLVNNK